MTRLNKVLLCIAGLLISTNFFQTTKLNAAVISPDKYYINMSPGESKNLELKLLADANQPATVEYFIYPMVMTKVGEEDDRNFIIPNANNQAEAANWVRLDITQVNLSAGDIVSIPFTVQVSSIANCGTNLVGIFVSTSRQSEFESNSTNSTGDSTVGIRNSLVSQLHINVDEPSKEYCKEVKTKLELEEFKADSALPIFNYDEIPFLTRIKNNGNLLSQSPKGFIELFGLGPKITISFNEDGLDIYPGTTRKFTNIWIDPEYPRNGNFFEQLFYELSHFKFGQYEARLGVTFNTNPKLVSSIYVWIIPWRVLLVFGSIVLIIAVLLIRDRRKSKELTKLKKSSNRK